jgi:rare lipoprotein A
MYAPATAAQPLAATPLAPIEITAAPAPAGSPAPPESQPSAATNARVSIVVSGAQLNVLAGEPASVSGRLVSDQPPAAQLAGRVVSLQARTPGGWSTLATATSDGGGRFRVRYVPASIGTRPVRVTVAGATGQRGAQRRLGDLNVYRVAVASWYGGGGTMACGGELTSATLGVANKTLPCGTPVTLRYEGRTVTVPVVDRGPYVEGREFDLTEATKNALGFEGVGEVWATA